MDFSAWITLLLLCISLLCLIYIVGRKNLLSSPAKIRKLRREVRNTPTVEKKLELAEAYGNSGKWEQAVQLYQECASGPFVDDPFVLFDYARALFHSGKLEKAEKVLNRIDRTRSRDKGDARRLLQLRILEITGRENEALASYPRLLETYSGEEARYRYALLLKRFGNVEQARAELQRIASAREQHSKLYRRQNRRWIKAARKRLKSCS